MAEKSAELLQMQQDAIRRVRLMQQRAMHSVSQAPASVSSPAPPEPKPRKTRLLPRKKPISPTSNTSLLEQLFTGEHDRALLLVLLLVLLDEKADTSLILALMYLIL